MALFCFNNTDAADAAPVLFAYEPLNPEWLYLPTLDAHDGKQPDFQASARLDHNLVVSAHGMEGGAEVEYSNRLPSAIQPFLPDRVLGGQFKSSLPNGDFFCSVESVRAGHFVPKRVRPKAA